MAVTIANAVSEMNQKRIDSLFYPVKISLRKKHLELKKGHLGQIK